MQTTYDPAAIITAFIGFIVLLVVVFAMFAVIAKTAHDHGFAAGIAAGDKIVQSYAGDTRLTGLTEYAMNSVSGDFLDKILIAIQNAKYYTPLISSPEGKQLAEDVSNLAGKFETDRQAYKAGTDIPIKAPTPPPSASISIGGTPVSLTDPAYISPNG